MTFLPRPDRGAPDYRALFEASSDGMLVVNPDGGIVLEANFAAGSLLGQDLVGKELPPQLQSVLRGETPICELLLGDRVIETAAAWPALGGARVLLLSL